MADAVRKATLACLGACGVALALAAAFQDVRPLRGQTLTILRDLPYRAGAGAATDRQLVDLYLPPGQGWPLALVIHGGDWRSGARHSTPGGRYDNVARALADHGIAVALVGHRLTDGGSSSTAHPGHASDVVAALAFARAFLVARGTRAGETFLVGHEAGAHLAALIATNPRFLVAEGLPADGIRGVIGLSGTYRVDPLGTRDADVFGSDPDARLDASPFYQVGVQAGSPAARFLLVVASQEHPGLADEARAFRQRVGAAGGVASIETSERDHDALVDWIGLSGDRTTARIVEAILDGRAATQTPSPTATTASSATSPATATATATPGDAHPPAAPSSGPGGAARPYAEVRRHFSEGSDGVWNAVWPAGDAPEALWPLIVFFPDAGASRMPLDYDAWLVHLARGGAVVVAPGLDPLSDDPAADASVLLARALADLRSSGVGADVDRRVYAGHGTGADVAMRLAAGWFQRGLPAPRALFAIGPRSAGDLAALARPGRLPGDAMAVLVSLAGGAQDGLSEDRTWRVVSALPGRQRAHLVLRSDGHGQPVLVADGTAPLTDGAFGHQDALDWRGTWRWLDALIACRLAGRWCDHVLEDPSAQLDVGRWSDGVPVTAAGLGGGAPRSPWVALPWGAARSNRLP